VTGLDIHHAEAREELADEGYHVVGHVLALSTADEEGRLLEAYLAGILEGEVAEVIECSTKDVQRDAELLRPFACWAS
jgi:hypothetical protein